MIKNKLLIVFILIIAVLSAYYLLVSLQSKSKTTSTGAIPLEDVASRKSLDEAIKLSSNQPITTDTFNILPKKGARFTVEIKQPYTQAKSSFSQWLFENGYGNIQQDSFQIVEIP